MVFIAGFLAGTFFGACALALLAGNDADLKDKRIRELRAANSTLVSEYTAAKARIEELTRSEEKV